MAANPGSHLSKQAVRVLSSKYKMLFFWISHFRLPQPCVFGAALLQASSWLF
jgi:hypothetical protein